MKTLEQFLEQVTDIKIQHENAVVEWQKEIEETSQKLESLEAEAALAVQSGKSNAYETAIRKADFCRERVKHLKSIIIIPEYTPETWRATVNEIKTQLSFEVLPFYERLWELEQEWNAVLEQLESKAKICSNINLQMKLTIGAKVFDDYGSFAVDVPSVIDYQKAFPNSVKNTVIFAKEFHEKRAKRSVEDGNKT